MQTFPTASLGLFLLQVEPACLLLAVLADCLVHTLCALALCALLIRAEIVLTTSKSAL